MKVKTVKYSAITLCLAVLLSGCATVQIYTASDLKKTSKSGIPFYTPKPYLLVEYNPAKDVAIKTTVIYLPDLENPRYAKVKAGIGSSDLKINLENGILTSYGITTDSKVPETITAMGGVIESVASLLPSIGGILGLNPETAEQSNEIDMKKATENTKKIRENLEKDLAKNKNWLSILKQGKVEEAVTALKEIEEKLDENIQKDIPEIAKKIEATIKQLDEAKLGADSPPSKEWDAVIEGYKKEIEKVKNSLVPPTKVESTISLYEIKQEKGTTKLVKVEF